MQHQTKCLVLFTTIQRTMSWNAYPVGLPLGLPLGKFYTKHDYKEMTMFHTDARRFIHL